MKIGQYEIDKKDIIANGSEGCIYNCKDGYNKGKELCAKIVQEMTSENFKKQDVILQKLFQHNNSNLVKIEYYQFDESTQSLIIIMEKCQSTLKDELDKRKKVSEFFSDEEILDFLKQFLSGYQILYNLKILHRDIKPENILINNQKGQLIYKLTDFGISKVCSSNSMYMTQIGTPIYAPPELNEDPKQEGKNNLIDINDPNPQSKRDVYALGLILHQMMKGELPFADKKLVEFRKQIEKVPFKIQNTNRCQILVDLAESMIQYYPQNRISIPTLNQRVQFPTIQRCPVIPNNFMPFKVQTQDNNNKQQHLNTFNHNSQSLANLLVTQTDNQQTKDVTKKINDLKVPTFNFNAKIINQKDNQKFRTTTQAQNFLNASVNIKSSFTESQIPNAILQKKNQDPQTQRERVQTEYCSQSQISQRGIKTIDVIKQYIQEAIINYECLISEEKLQKLKSLNQNQQKLSEESERLIKSIFKYEKDKISIYKPESLLFYYCLNNCKQQFILLPSDQKECINYITKNM